MAIKHAKTSAKDDGGDATLVLPSDWNASHVGDIPWSLVTGATNAAAGNGYLCNTSGGAFELTLPGAPTAGDLVAVADAASTFHTTNLTIGRNALNIMGLAEDLVVNVKDVSFSLVYASAALGWRIAT
jgi:hypothetical protein